MEASIAPELIQLAQHDLTVRERLGLPPIVEEQVDENKNAANTDAKQIDAGFREWRRKAGWIR